MRGTSLGAPICDGVFIKPQSAGGYRRNLRERLERGAEPSSG